MIAYKYRLNSNLVIEKSTVELCDEPTLKTYYYVKGAGAHPYIRRNKVDNFPKNLSAALYLTVENDKSATEHFRNLLEGKVDKTYVEYTKAQNKLNVYKGEMVNG